MSPLRILFFGTPEFAAHILHDLREEKTLEIIGVVSSPDKVGGRGHELIASPVAKYAREHEMNLLQPEKIRNNNEFINAVRELKPDICIVVAYGKILPQELLDIPPMGFINVHPSLLPKYRGPTPIQTALLMGEKKTGVTIMQLNAGMDEGDILLQECWAISPEDTTATLFEKTGKRGTPLLIDTLKSLVEKDITPRMQDSKEATYTKMIEKTDGEIKPEWSADNVYNAWQAYTPWPGIYTYFGETRVSLQKIGVHLEKHHEKPMSWKVISNMPALVVKDGYIIVNELTPAGKKTMKGEDFVRGYMRNGD